MKFSARALVWFLGFAGVFWSLLRFSSRTDPIVHALLWAYLAAVSVVAVVIAIRRGGTPGQTDALPDFLRRWVLGESEEHREHRS